MPWLIRKQGERYCVYKEGPDGKPTGSARGCHDSRAKAERQRRALYRNVPEMSAQMSTFDVMNTSGGMKYWFLPTSANTTWNWNATSSLGSFEVSAPEAVSYTHLTLPTN